MKSSPRKEEKFRGNFPYSGFKGPGSLASKASGPMLDYGYRVQGSFPPAGTYQRFNSSAVRPWLNKTTTALLVRNSRTTKA